jgi:D-alanyl-lipoteichoic acid acyltransferase DltB (MBOAT superfamily)
MNYFSPAYIFFLAFGLLVFHFLPGKWKPWFLIGLSAAWCVSWNTEWAILYFAVLNFNYLVLRFIRKDSQYWCLILLDVLLFVLLRTNLVPQNFMNPFGQSFFFFMLFGLIIDQWRMTQVENYRYEEFILMPVFFPLLMSGPLERGKHFFSSLRNPNESVWQSLNNGLLLFMYGFGKRFLLLPVMVGVRDFFLTLPGSIPVYIMIGLVETLTVYVELSCYAQMGRGAARMFGIDVFVNFKPIYYSKNPNDFWARWNITLGTWIRDYVSFPLMLKFGRKLHQNALLMFTFFLVGIWHGFDLDWVIFGIFNGLMVVLFNTFNKKFRLASVGRIFSFLLIMGNGLILNIGNLKDFKEALPDLSYLNYMPFTYSAFFILFLVTVLEFIEEKKQDPDWYMKLSNGIKLGTNIVLILLLLFALDFELIPYLDREIHLPVYFKI